MFKHIIIGNDHGGLEAKREIMAYLLARGVRVTNVGSDSGEIVRYPYFAAKVASAVSRGEADAGILICSTGIGMSIVANKFKNVRAALCSSHYAAVMTRRHNDANVLCLGGRTLGQFVMTDILEGWLDSEFEGGRHSISLAMLKDCEAALNMGGDWQPPMDLDPAAFEYKEAPQQ